MFLYDSSRRSKYRLTDRQAGWQTDRQAGWLAGQAEIRSQQTRRQEETDRWTGLKCTRPVKSDVHADKTDVDK